jgi:hypothetical protein
MDVFEALRYAGYPMEVRRFPDGQLYWKIQSNEVPNVKTTDDDRAEAFAKRVAVAKKTKPAKKPAGSILGCCRSCCGSRDCGPRDRAKCENFLAHGKDCMGEGPDTDDEDVQEVMEYLDIPAEGEEDEICIVCNCVIEGEKIHYSGVRYTCTDCADEGEAAGTPRIPSPKGQEMRQDSAICSNCRGPVDRHSCHLMGYCHECSIDMDGTKAAKPAEPEDEDGFTVVEKQSTRRMKKAIRGRPGQTGRRFH